MLFLKENTIVPVSFENIAPQKKALSIRVDSHIYTFFVSKCLTTSGQSQGHSKAKIYLSDKNTFLKANSRREGYFTFAYGLTYGYQWNLEVIRR